jgi:regulator of sigma E protease
MAVLTVTAVKKLITGKINPKHLSGPIDIAKVSQQAMESGMSNFFMLIAFLSLHIGILNLLPIPVLDGGHLMIYSIESIIRRDFNAKVKTVLMNIGFFILVALMAFAILNDIAKTLPHGWKSLLPF